MYKQNQSFYVDKKWYLETYPDVAAAVSNGDYSSGCKHYYVNGQEEGRSPGDTCDEAYYLSIYPDVSAAVSNGDYSSGCAHYYLYGREEGRVAENPDADGDGLTENQGDCDDTDASINLSATEICGDGIDQDCDGADDECDTGGGDSGGGDSGGGDSGGGDATTSEICCECTYSCEGGNIRSETIELGDKGSCAAEYAAITKQYCGGTLLDFSTNACQ